MNQLQIWTQVRTTSFGFKKHLSDETVLIVTHRMAPLSLVDRIIVLDSGRVAVDGPKT